MRLINKDKLLEETRRDRDYAAKNGAMDMYYERQALIDRIDAQPTAYDVDKVVEQLEDRKSLMLDTFKISESDIDRGKIYGMDKAIEIVKGGGANGD